MFVSKWNAADQKPAIFAVRGATKPRFILEGFSTGNRLEPLLGMTRKILRMDSQLPATTCCVLDRKPGVFGPAPVHKYAAAVGQCSEGHRRNCFHDIPQMLFLQL